MLDPFVGSGSTLLACHATGRKGVGIELIDRWRTVACERMEAAGAAWSEDAEDDSQADQVDNLTVR